MGIFHTPRRKIRFFIPPRTCFFARNPLRQFYQILPSRTVFPSDSFFVNYTPNGQLFSPIGQFILKMLTPSDIFQ